MAMIGIALSVMGLEKCMNAVTVSVFTIKAAQEKTHLVKHLLAVYAW